MKKILSLLLAISLCFAFASCGTVERDADYEEENETTAYEEVTQEQPEETEKYEVTTNKDTKNYPKVEIKVKNYGSIKLQLDSLQAPETVKNFVSLVKKGFYDGLTFHRIMSNFMIQGGDPKGNGTGGNVVNGQEVNVKGEFSANGVNNTISHKKGVISMARATAYDTASSQFFICNADASASLDGQYAAFGYVYEGIEVVDKITADVAPKATDTNGTIQSADQPVIQSIKVIEE